MGEGPAVDRGITCNFVPPMEIDNYVKVAVAFIDLREPCVHAAVNDLLGRAVDDLLGPGREIK